MKEVLRFPIYYLMETKDKTKEGKIQRLHWEILKTWVLHKECCVQSLWEDLQYSGQWQKQKMSPQGCKNGECVLQSVGAVHEKEQDVIQIDHTKCLIDDVYQPQSAPSSSFEYVFS